METPKKRRRPGRPRLPKHEAKGRIVPIRLRTEDLRRAITAAKASEKTLSEWIRNLIHAGVNQ